jgi:hypothetical protein
MRRVLFALALALLLLSLPAAPAHSKGPTSALIASPDTGAAAALVDSDRLFELLRLLEPMGEVSAPPRGAQWQEVTVSWLMMESTIWRADTVKLDGHGTALVRENVPFGAPTSTSSGWHRVRDGAALSTFLGDLGVLPGHASAVDPASEPNGGTDVQASPADLPAESEATSSSWISLDGWLWVLPGVLAGLVLGALGAPLLRRRVPQVVAQRFARS